MISSEWVIDMNFSTVFMVIIIYAIVLSLVKVIGNSVKVDAINKAECL